MTNKKTIGGAIIPNFAEMTNALANF